MVKWWKKQVEDETFIFLLVCTITLIVAGIIVAEIALGFKELLINMQG